MEELKPRPYQSQIENICIEKNTIVYLPTGSGKTFITIRIMKRLQQPTQIPFSKGGLRTFFLVNTVPLVFQHVKTIKQLTPFTVRGLSGQDRVDIWNETQWHAALEDTQVLVMTAQILLDVILHGYLKISQINLIIFDECHAAVENHPMRQVMDRISKATSGDTPRIIGLTATLLNKTIQPGEVQSTIESLEKTFKATICTAENWADVIVFAANPSEIVIGYDEYNKESCPIHEIVDKELEKLSNILQNTIIYEDMNPTEKSGQDVDGFQCLSSGKKTIKKIQRLLKTINRAYKDLGLFSLSISLLTTIVKLERLKLKASLEVKTILQFFITVAVRIRGIIERYMCKDHGVQKVLEHSSHKVKSLIDMLREYSHESMTKNNAENRINKLNKELCCIVFVKERSTALILYVLFKMLKELESKSFEFLNHDYITGFNINPYSDTREDLFIKKKNMETISKFRARLLNCLISTSILEEGFDLPDCNLIIHFDDLITFRSYIQSKGRGRHNMASFVMMIPLANIDNFTKNFNTFGKVLETLNEILIGKSNKRLSPTDEEVSLSFQQDVEPFIHQDACITVNSAISVLNRYLSSLPHDIYTSSQPVWYYKKISTSGVVSLTLPVNCVLKKKFQSPVVTNIKDTKQIIALDVCKELHRIGELNDKLLPTTREEVILNETNHQLFFSHWNKYDQEMNSLEITKSEKTYLRKYSRCLRGTSDSQNTFYLYKINIEPVNVPDNNIFKIINSPYNFGMLTYRKLEKMCPFSLFLSSGEVLVTIELTNGTIKLSNEEFYKIKRFHFMLFSDIIGINLAFTAFNPNCNNIHLFIVPLIGENFELDWDVMTHNTEVEEFGEPSIDERKALNFKNEDYLYQIVNPWYRGESLCRYIVTDIHEDLSPRSLFPTSNFESFADYFQEKYKLTILGSKDQPLLGVHHIGGKINCLLPRSISLSPEDSVSRRKMKSTLFAASMEMTSHDEFLIPEYCIKYSFPGIYWFKSSLVPSIIHRITMLTQAEELRQEISSQIDINYAEISEELCWNKLTVDIHALRDSHKKILSPETVRHSSPTNEDVSSSPSKINVSSLQVSYEITKKNLDSEFPWPPEEEPVDIYKNIDKINLIDIECYEKFVKNKPLDKENNPVKLSKDHPPKKFSARAICPPPHKYNDVIRVLSKTPSQYGPTLDQILAALTTSKCNDVFNLERYEILGDSFLKFAVSLYLWHCYPQYNEGHLTSLKGKIVSNRNLFFSGSLFYLGNRMNVKQFNAKSDWIPPCFAIPTYIYDLIDKEVENPSTLNVFDIPKDEILSGELSADTLSTIKESFEKYSLTDTKYDYSITNSFMGKQAVRNKSIADAVEALIGIYLLDSGLEGGFKMLKWLQILPLKSGDEYVDYLKISVDTPLKSGTTTKSNISYQLNYFTSEIEKILGYKFNDTSFLLEALSHSSNIRNNLTGCYQRLEFIGDAILDFLITTYIYENCTTLSPGDITDLRSALVNNVTFACIVVRLGLQKFVLTVNNDLDKAMQKFIQYQDDRGHIIDETVLFLLDEKDCHLADYVDVPKVLGDVFESLAGAIFFDSGNDLNAVWKVFYRFMHVEIEAFSNDIPKQPVRLLYERIHAQPKFLNSLLVKEGGRIMVPLKINVAGKTEIVHGFGFNRKNAKRSAAKIALKMLDN